MTVQDPAPAYGNDVAITGIALRVPGADDVNAFWQLTAEGTSTFRSVSRAESERFGYTSAQIDDEDFVSVVSALDDIDAFDHDAFGISARDAALMDPQHRVFLECARSALDDAGFGDVTGLKVGVFGSASSSTYLTGPVRAAGLWDESDLNFSAMLANDKDFLCTRTSYALGLTGPSVVVQSACSSSLLAVHLARQALLHGECDAAIVGGVSISIPHLGGYLKRSGSIFSPTGSCRPFDRTADGTVKAHGAAAVVLVRSEDANLQHVYANVAGTAANNDGADKVGFPAPGVSGQAAVIRSAMASAGITADQVRYIESHGTGTLLGDPIEIRALRLAREGSTKSCYLGSAKANVGHLDAAAGVMGLVRAALVLEKGVIPPLAGFSESNPLLDVGEEVVLPTEPVDAPWLTHAGVSSFGMGGSNVHAILRRRADARGRQVSPQGRRLVRTRHWVGHPRHTRTPEVSKAAGRTTESARSVSLPSLEELLATVREVLQLPELAAEDRLVDAGADSLALIDITAALAERHGTALDVAELERIGTVEKLFQTHVIDRTSGKVGPVDEPTRRHIARQPRSAFDNVVHITPPRERTFFLVHPAGGTTTCYAGVATHIGEDVGVTGLTFPADFLGQRITMRELAASYLATITGIQPSGPYLIGGYSFGGNLAAELALQLEEAGETVELLVMIDSHPPHAYTSGACDEQAYVAAFPALLSTLVPGIRFAEDVRARADARGILEAVEHPAWPETVRNEFARFFEIWRENHGVLKRWTPDRLIDCPVLIIEASEPEPEEVLDCLSISPSTVNEWSRYLSQAPQIIGVDGDHYSIFRDLTSLRRIGEILGQAATQRELVR
ncbi:beta-ketoacyl synthase N-terminal-like domain-containing protein [Leucobacter chromiireducens]|uniref:Carrier domain-containing protein n=1 Tax=Leucobacter chromiireducens subsp. chromiireducens TaxID=660067 RepID=A0ABS1SQY8_9MICO|nr:beta-ketoacyl synthase N-terminal-like domain-containing protein [Leucobacter chromiireducens]MBL3689537.1 hypothetical protein [Leucobacter chromiireducens subsp. chromiireducens]